VLSLALPFYYLFATVGAMLGVGGAQICAKLIGWQRHEECRRAFSLVYVLAALLGILFAAILFYFIDPLLALMGTPSSLLEPTRGYLRVLCLGGVFIIGIYPAFNMLRLDGQTTRAALLFVGMGILSVTLDLLFLLGFGWGIEALALALCLSYGATAVSGALMLMRRSLNFRFVFPFSGGLKDTFRLMRSIVSTGSPNALEDICIVLRTFVVNNVAIVSFGTTALGAYVLLDSLVLVALVFAAGVSGAAMAFLSVFTAEKDSLNTMKILKLGFVWGVPAIVALMLIIELLAPPIAQMFGATTAGELSTFSVALRIFASGLPLLLFNYVMITVYQSQGRMLASNTVVFLRELVGPLALMGLLTIPFGMTGIWAAFPAAELLTTIMVLLYGFWCRRKNRQLSPVFLVDRQVEHEGESISLIVRNDKESIASAVSLIEEFCERKKLSSRLIMGAQLALEEMLVEIGKNSLSGMANHTINVRLLMLGDKVIMRIRNGGTRFNPIEYAERLSRVPLRTKLMDNRDAKESVSIFKHDGDAASDVIPEQDVPLELTGIMMILKMAEMVDYRSTFGFNNLMLILHG
jgi:Na+-driven multidrug efflux pump